LFHRFLPEQSIAQHVKFGGHEKVMKKSCFFLSSAAGGRIYFLYKEIERQQ